AWEQHARGCGWGARPTPSRTPGRCPATIPRPARLLGVRAARLRPAMWALLAGGAPGPPRPPDAGPSRLPRCPSAAAPGPRPPRALKKPPLHGHGRGQDQRARPEGKTTTSGGRWCGDHLEWKGLVLSARRDPKDPVQAHGLACPVTYVRLVRRTLGVR